MHCIKEIFQEQLRIERKRPRVREILAQDLHNRNQLVFEDVDRRWLHWLHRFFEESPQSEWEDDCSGACCNVSGCEKYQWQRYSALKYIFHGAFSVAKCNSKKDEWLCKFCLQRVK